MIERYGKYIIGFILGILTTSVINLTIDKKDLNEELTHVSSPVIKTDTKTITKTDTITKTIYKPKYISKVITKTDTIIQGDNKVSIPITTQSYITKIDTDTLSGIITTNISGYEPSLDTITYDFRVKTKTITQTTEIQTTKYKKQHFNFTMGIGGGYGIITKKPDIYIGGVVGYTF